MSSFSLLLCRALMIEFVVILLSLLGVGSLFFGIEEALDIIINFFIFILVGAICCIPIAIGIGEYLSRSNKFLIKKLPLGILLMLFPTPLESFQVLLQFLLDKEKVLYLWKNSQKCLPFVFFQVLFQVLEQGYGWMENYLL